MRPVRLAIAAAALSFAGACASDPADGYALDWAFDDGVQSIAVPIFENSTFATGAEYDLTEALIAELQASTPWVVTTPERADTVLTGDLIAVQATALSSNPGTGYAQENALRMTVDFTWRDNRTGEPRVARRNFSAVSTYAPSAPTSERREVGQRTATRALAKGIVAQLRDSW